MLPRKERAPGKRALRSAWMVIAVLAALFVGVAGVDGRADAESYDPEELQFLELINGYRADHGLRALVLSDTLAVAAEHHSRDMARYSFSAHNTAGSSYYAAGSKPYDRMATATTPTRARTSPSATRPPKRLSAPGANPPLTTRPCSTTGTGLSGSRA